MINIYVDPDIPKNYIDAIKYIRKNIAIKSYTGVYNNLADAAMNCVYEEESVTVTCASGCDGGNETYKIFDHWWQKVLYKLFKIITFRRGK